LDTSFLIVMVVVYLLMSLVSRLAVSV
jgi:hypothetical protein